MKIAQIILDDYDNYGSTGQSATPEPSATTTDKQDSKEKSADDNSPKEESSSLPDIGIDLKSLGVGALAFGGAALAASATIQVVSKVSANYARKLRLTDRVLKMQKAKLGPWNKFFGFIGIATAVTQLYENLYASEALYLQGKINEDQLKRNREFEFGVFNVQILTPAIVRVLGRLIMTLTGIKWLVRFLGGVSTYATMGATLAATIASEAFIRWFQTWLGTETGRNYISHYAGQVVQTFGAYTTEPIWSGIFNYYNKVEIKKHGSPEKAKAAKQEREKEKQAAPGEQHIKMVGDIQVTDNEGYLLPTGSLMTNMELKLLRKQAVAAGKPDPLAQFPRRKIQGPGGKMVDPGLPPL